MGAFLAAILTYTIILMTWPGPENDFQIAVYDRLENIEGNQHIQIFHGSQNSEV
jgi:hypothetical protein